MPPQSWPEHPSSSQQQLPARAAPLKVSHLAAPAPVPPVADAGGGVPPRGVPCARCRRLHIADAQTPLSAADRSVHTVGQRSCCLRASCALIHTPDATPVDAPSSAGPSSRGCRQPTEWHIVRSKDDYCSSGGTHRCRVVLKLLAAIMRIVLHRVAAGAIVDALLVPARLLVVVAAAAHTKPQSYSSLCSSGNSCQQVVWISLAQQQTRGWPQSHQPLVGQTHAAASDIMQQLPTGQWTSLAQQHSGGVQSQHTPPEANPCCRFRHHPH